MTEPLVRYRVRGRRCTLTINRPDAMNALNREARVELGAAVRRFTQDDEIWVAILIGEGGRAFSAGADVKEMAAEFVSADAIAGGEQPEMAAGLVPRPGGLPGFDELYACPKPVIAAIDGHCLGGGLELALCCDVRVATVNSLFGMPEPRTSLMGGFGLVNLARMIPVGEALRIQLSAEPMTAQRAYQVGLVQELADDRAGLVALAEQLADQIVGCAPKAVRAIKRVVRASTDVSARTAWNEAEAAYAEVLRSEDMAEGLRSFTERRRAVWRNR